MSKLKRVLSRVTDYNYSTEKGHIITQYRVLYDPSFSLFEVLKFQIISSYFKELSFDTPSFYQLVLRLFMGVHFANHTFTCSILYSPVMIAV